MGIFENTILVNKKVSAGNLIGRILCIILSGFCFLISLTILPGLLFIPALLFGALYYFLYIESKTEYEYTYIEGRLSFAKIKAKRRRKELAKVEMEEALLIAPSSAGELRQYHENGTVSRKDFSSKNASAKTYEVVYKLGEGVALIVFEPDRNMLELMRLRNGHKVVIE